MKRADHWRTQELGWMVAVAALTVVAGLAHAQVNEKRLVIRRSSTTGLASFITAADGEIIPLKARAGGDSAQPLEFLRDQGHHFGITDPVRQLILVKSAADGLGRTHSTYQQVHAGVRVFSAEVKVHQNAGGAFYAANGDFHPISPSLNTVPSLSAEEAAALARAELFSGMPHVEHSELVIVDPGWYGDPPIGDHLAHYLILTDPIVPIREAFFVDAHTGRILDQWNLVHTIKDRVVLDDSQPGTPVVRTEAGPPAGDFEADAAFDWAGDTYDLLFRAFGRDSVDDAGGTMFATVHLQSGSCPNAFGGISTRYCDGVVTDDVVAHEFTHGLTGFTAGLIYQNQSGQLNESFSDVFGEMVDLFNGDASLPGSPGGVPTWPSHPTGPGTDTPNSMRGAGCVGGVSMEVNGPPAIAGIYLAGAATFGPALSETGITGDVVVANPVRACDVDLPFTNSGAMSGRIVLVDRGTCPFNEKVENAQNAGAIGVMVANNVASGFPPTLSGSNPAVTIPSVGITQSDGTLIKNAALSETVNVTLRANSGTEGVRWLVSEDSSAFGGHIRDMWWPSCEGDPDTANHPLQTCSTTDNGGVHSGSGVPNHAFAILSDGKTFNGQSVTGIGLIKAGAVWYRALTTYLTAASDFQDAYYALNQAAADLIDEPVFDPRDGTVFGTFTVADAAEVDKALLAVELNTDGACGASVAILDPITPNLCFARNVIYGDDFESGVGGWTVSNTGPFGPPTPYDWVQVSGGLPFSHPGTVWFADDPSIGDCAAVDESAVHSLFSPTIALPASLNSPTLRFTHYLATEPGWDGGNVKISVNGGGWAVIPFGAITFNPYNDTINPSGNTNPLAGELAWTGAGGGWGTTMIDLSGLVSGGDDVRFRFDLGKDGCTGISGWFLDDLEVYTCPPAVSKFLQGPDGLGESLVSNVDWAAGGLMNFTVNLDESQAAQCAGTGSAATGAGTFTIDPATQEASYDISFAGLSSAETVSHVHGPALPCVDNFNLYDLPLGSPKIGTGVLVGTQMTDMMNDLHYVNIHSDNFFTGEIRGQIIHSVDVRTLADDFISDGRPISGLRWWGSDFGTATIDGWFVSFHQPSVLAMPPVPALALYFCGSDVVTGIGVAISSCDGAPLTEYVVDLASCCLVHAGVDPRSGQTPGQPLAFLEEECFDYGLGIQAVVGREFVRNELGECVEVATGNTAAEDFWGWRTTGNDFGFTPAVSSPVVMGGASWDYGPWSQVQPGCGMANMAFEVLTTQAGTGDCNGNQLPDQCEADCNGSGAPDDCDIANCDGSSGCSDCNKNQQPDECDIAGGTPDLNGNGVPDECEPVGDPSAAPYPHDRRKNRYVSFDPNKAENDGIDIAFRVELLALTLGSCEGNGGFCREDRGDDDCKACSVAGNPCINQPIDCAPMPPQTCNPTGETCVNDAPNAGGTSAGRVWWIGPESPLGNGVHLMVSQPFRKVSDNWPNPVHAGDCEIVPQGVYGVRAVNTNTETASAEAVVETALFASISASWWADCVGPLKKFCGGDTRTPQCAGDGECTLPETCEFAWTLPDGSVNFDDIGAALALVAPGPGSTPPDMTWMDLHGNGSGTSGSQNFDPPNFVANFSDVGQIIFGFQGLPYKGYDPADCPDTAAWP